MKWSKIDFLNSKTHEIVFEEEIEIQPDFFKKEHQIRGLKDIVVSGKLQYEERDDLVLADIEVEGTMILPCSLTLEDVEYEFTTESYEVFSFSKKKVNEDVHPTNGQTLELLQVVIQLISMEIPMRIVKNENPTYLKGEDWEIISEESYRNREKPLDPRLAKLKEFKFEE